ncbi:MULTISPECIES: hypothetical protein [unclassified Microcoleus]
MNLWRCGDGDNLFGWIILSEAGLPTVETISAMKQQSIKSEK